MPIVLGLNPESILCLSFVRRYNFSAFYKSTARYLVRVKNVRSNFCFFPKFLTFLFAPTLAFSHRFRLSTVMYFHSKTRFFWCVFAYRSHWNDRKRWWKRQYMTLFTSLFSKAFVSISPYITRNGTFPKCSTFDLELCFLFKRRYFISFLWNVLAIVNK